MSLYISRVTELATKAAEINDAALSEAAGMMAETVANGGLIHLYGSGHSVLPAQETFPRYGAFIAFHPLTDPRLMWHSVLAAGGVRELLWLERTEGYAEKFLDHQPINPGDTLVVFGHSGTNSSGIDTALYCKKRGVKVIAVNSAANRNKPAKHSSGKNLADCADVAIDTCSPVEDAVVPIDGWSRPVGGSSTVLAMMLMHEMAARTAQNLADRGIELPVFASPTIPGVTLHDTDEAYAEYKKKLIEAQQKHLSFFADRMSGKV
ncbi:SIS domain-containing protein [Frigidibacter sp. ROC022]|uniref:SIS domain-containing protein n=1 Tax=Frigidibacter sp. ROC022 TaxID=2971796 RepID=UPI00215AD189|nr:SIS domain-containing protein [Frigidibacter sp. ROC022]MCR8724623.1 SIS domain-containing protein [Frigidibacter sp. ROC022]